MKAEPPPVSGTTVDPQDFDLTDRERYDLGRLMLKRRTPPTVLWLHMAAAAGLPILHAGDCAHLHGAEVTPPRWEPVPAILLRTLAEGAQARWAVGQRPPFTICISCLATGRNL